LTFYISGDYDLIMLYIKRLYMWYNDDEVCFTVLKMMAIFVGNNSIILIVKKTKLFFKECFSI